jgi:hypothetical protein
VYEVPKQSYQLCGPIGVSYDLFALLFLLVFEVLKCFEKWGNDTSTSLNAENLQNEPIHINVAPIHSQTSIFRFWCEIQKSCPAVHTVVELSLNSF